MKALKEKKRIEEGISEYLLVKCIPLELRQYRFNSNMVKIFKADEIFREYYSVGRGMEYSFNQEMSFREVVVGFRYRKRLPKKKKQAWSKKPYYFTGFVGPMIWNPTVGDSSKAYVVRFLDGDIRCSQLMNWKNFWLMRHHFFKSWVS